MGLVFSNRTSKPPPNGDMWVDSAAGSVCYGRDIYIKMSLGADIRKTVSLARRPAGLFNSRIVFMFCLIYGVTLEKYVWG